MSPELSLTLACLITSGVRILLPFFFSLAMWFGASFLIFIHLHFKW
jgi:hypothetical protein